MTGAHREQVQSSCAPNKCEGAKVGSASKIRLVSDVGAQLVYAPVTVAHGTNRLFTEDNKDNEGNEKCDVE